MSWFLLALIGHLANGVAFVIDKILLRSSFSRSATYAGLVGLLSTFALFAMPFVSSFPRGSAWLLSIVSGITFILALWAFFAALARAEASRVVPIIGSLVPILTLAGTFVFLGERLTDATFLGFGCLIFATFLLSRGGTGEPTSLAIWLAVTSAVLFAIASVTGKATYDAAGFLAGFVTSRLAAAITALLLLTMLDRQAGREALHLIRSMRRNRSSQRAATKTRQSAQIALLALIGQGLGAVGFLFVQWAMAQGSASIVNAMQAVQYALLVIIALVLRHRAPQLLGENLSRGVLIRKTVALGIAAIGLYLIV